ncbi:kinase-like protein [Hypoxylon sp. EC38]|nr:kinase-like protein [Hypoxylon sp. EC38]
MILICCGRSAKKLRTLYGGTNLESNGTVRTQDKKRLLILRTQEHTLKTVNMSLIDRENKRREFYDRFDHYRAGRYWDKDKRRAQGFGFPRLPLSGKPTLDRSKANTQKILAYRRAALKDRTNIEKTPVRPLRFNSARARQGLLQIKEGFGDKRKFRFKRVLGWGGNGLATHFIEVGDNDVIKRQVAVKMMLRSDDPQAADFMEEERDILRMLAKSEHIVQLIDLPGSELITNQPAKDSNKKSNEKEERTTESFDAIVMELVKNGDLHQFICKVSELGQRVPNQILWEFFLCLIRGCIAMAYPPSSQAENEGRPGPIRETIPEGKANNPGLLVHLDLDPKNIFLDDIQRGGDLPSDEHKGIPILKMGDFGSAREVKKGQSNWYYERLRTQGKHGFYSPEQFCNDWDYIRPNEDTVKNEEVAGNFAHHTNLWQVGLTLKIMESLITLKYPAFPPVPSWCRVTPPEGKELYATYGYHLEGERFRHVDPDLRYLVYRCQAHFPADRPSLTDAENIILTALKKPQYSNIFWQQNSNWVTRVMLSANTGDRGMDRPPTKKAPPAKKAPPTKEAPPTKGAPPAPPTEEGGVAPPPATGTNVVPMSVEVIDPAPEVLPRPPAVMDSYGAYYPPPYGGPAFPAYIPGAPMRPPEYPPGVVGYGYQVPYPYGGYPVGYPMGYLADYQEDNPENNDMAAEYDLLVAAQDFPEGVAYPVAYTYEGNAAPYPEDVLAGLPADHAAGYPYGAYPGVYGYGDNAGPYPYPVAQQAAPEGAPPGTGHPAPGPPGPPGPGPR